MHPCQHFPLGLKGVAQPELGAGLVERGVQVVQLGMVNWNSQEKKKHFQRHCFFRIGFLKKYFQMGVLYKGKPFFVEIYICPDQIF